jgi:hypothetical protein
MSAYQRVSGSVFRDAALRVVLLVALLLVFSCSSGDDSSGSDVPEGYNQEAFVVHGPDGARLEVPAGSVPSGTSISIRRAVEQPELGLFIPVGRAYEIRPSGTEFRVPATLVLPYQSFRVPEDQTASDIAVFTAQSNGESWEELDASVDAAGDAAGTVRASLGHLCFFLPGVSVRARYLPKLLWCLGRLEARIEALPCEDHHGHHGWWGRDDDDDSCGGHRCGNDDDDLQPGHHYSGREDDDRDHYDNHTGHSGSWGRFSPWRHHGWSWWHGHRCGDEPVLDCGHKSSLLRSVRSIKGELLHGGTSESLYERLVNEVLARMDGHLGGDPSDDWITSQHVQERLKEALDCIFLEDFDKDGLTFEDEVSTYGTNPFDPDTDGDGLNDGEEVEYWNSRTDGIGWDADVEPIQNFDGSQGDGLPNVIDPDSDGDGLLDGEEVNGWDIVVNGSDHPASSDPAFANSDEDLLPDRLEHDGWDQLLHGTTRTIRTDPSSADTDGDGLEDRFEKGYGLDASDAATLGYMRDSEWWSIVLNIGSWATKPYSAHLDPRHSPQETAILVFEKDYLADVDTELKATSSMDFSIHIPQERAGTHITLQLDFLGPTDSNDNFYDVIYGKTEDPERPGEGHVVAWATCPEGGDSVSCEGESVSWTITDPTLLAEGDWFFRFTNSYDKDAGEPPRTLRVQVLYDDDTYVSMIYYCDIPEGSHHSTAQYTYTVTGGATPAFFRGETIIESGAGNSYADSIRLTDYNGNLVREIGRKAFNGHSFQFPLGTLAEYDPATNDLTTLNKLVWDWTHDDGLASRFMTHIDEAGNDWSDVQVTYDVAYHSNEYESWSGGIATAPAVVRRGANIRVVGTSTELETQDAVVTVKDSAGEDVTSTFGFTVTEELDYRAYDGTSWTWRENQIVSIPWTVPVGRYTIEMVAGAWTGSAELSVIFDPYATAVSEAEREAYAYDEDSNGFYFGGDDGSSRHTLGKWYHMNKVSPEPGPGDEPTGLSTPSYVLNPQSEAVFRIAEAVIDGHGDEADAREAIREFVGEYIVGAWGAGYGSGESYPYPYPYDIPVDETIIASGVTPEQAADTQLLGDAQRPRAQCMDFGGVATALSRSIGLTTRLASGWMPWRADDTTYEPSSTRWNFHVWTETWLPQPPTGTQAWYVYDSTDFAGSLTGSSASRTDFDAVWDPFRVYVADGAMTRTEVTDYY